MEITITIEYYTGGNNGNNNKEIMMTVTQLKILIAIIIDPAIGKTISSSNSNATIKIIK